MDPYDQTIYFYRTEDNSLAYIVHNFRDMFDLDDAMVVNPSEYRTVVL